MMSKYNQPVSTGWIKKRFPRAAFLTLALVSTTASPVFVMPSLAQEPRSSDQSQQKPAGESQSPPSPDHGYQWERRIQQKPAGELQSPTIARDRSIWKRQILRIPAGKSPSSAPVSDGSTWEQQSPASELQNSEAVEATQDVSGQAASTAEFFFVNFDPWMAIAGPFTANPGDQEVIIQLPVPSSAVSVWITEALGGPRAHFGSAVFKTTSVQLSEDKKQIRVKYRLEYTRSLPALAMVVF